MPRYESETGYFGIVLESTENAFFPQQEQKIPEEKTLNAQQQELYEGTQCFAADAADVQALAFLLRTDPKPVIDRLRLEATDATLHQGEELTFNVKKDSDDSSPTETVIFEE